MSPQAAWQQARYARLQTLGLFAAIGILAGVVAIPAMAQQVTNQNPVAVADSATTAEDIAVIIAVLANDSDPEGNTLTVSGTTNPTHGTIAVNAGNTITYTPTANFHGTDSFTYVVSDGNGGTSSGVVTVTVTPVNDAPVAVADTGTANAGTATVAVLLNDTDADGDTLSVTAVTQGAHGTVAASAAGVIAYTPTAGFSGTDTFTYTISDGHGGTATGTVVMTVTAGNRAPVATNDSLSLRQDTSKTVVVLLNDTDPDGDSLLVTTVTQPAHGTVVLNANSSITYTPAAGYLGPDSFTYTVMDPSGATAIGTVAISVTVRGASDDRPDRTDVDSCKKGGWVELGFRNQGLCVSAAVRGADLDAAADAQPGHGRGRGRD
jgi:large repetitive protein